MTLMWRLRMMRMRCMPRARPSKSILSKHVRACIYNIVDIIDDVQRNMQLARFSESFARSFILTRKSQCSLTYSRVCICIPAFRVLLSSPEMTYSYFPHSIELTLTAGRRFTHK